MLYTVHSSNTLTVEFNHFLLFVWFQAALRGIKAKEVLDETKRKKISQVEVSETVFALTLMLSESVPRWISQPSFLDIE